MSNIKLSNNVKIEAESLNIGMDTSNLIVQSHGAWTATQDCWVNFHSTGSGYGDINLDGVMIDSSGNYMSMNYIFVKKGQAITMTNSQIYRAFGVK